MNETLAAASEYRPNIAHSVGDPRFDVGGKSDFYYTNPHGDFSRSGNLVVAEPSPDTIRVAARDI